MRAVILAAGRGTRLNGIAGDQPKAWSRSAASTLVERQIRVLRAAGLRDIAVVVGCQADRVRAHCGAGVTYVENERFAETNSLYSLWLARPLLYDGFVVLNCDVLFHPQLLRDLLAARHEAALLLAYRQVGDPPFGDEEMKVQVQAGRVVAMSKTMTPDEADGENVGVLRFDANVAPRLVEHLDRIVAEGGLREWAPRAFAAFAAERPCTRSARAGTRGSRSIFRKTTSARCARYCRSSRMPGSVVRRAASRPSGGSPTPWPGDSMYERFYQLRERPFSLSPTPTTCTRAACTGRR
jgi:L-glutamine-phosphate cytidylyltransferase